MTVFINNNTHPRERPDMLLRRTPEKQKNSELSRYYADERGNPTARLIPGRSKPSSPTGIMGAAYNYVTQDHPPPGIHSSTGRWAGLDAEQQSQSS